MNEQERQQKIAELAALWNKMNDGTKTKARKLMLDSLAEEIWELENA